MVQVHHDEGVANRIDPESCADAREGIGEALTGERIGQPLSRESTLIPGADVVPLTEGNTDGRDNAALSSWKTHGHKPSSAPRFMRCRRSHSAPRTSSSAKKMASLWVHGLDANKLQPPPPSRVQPYAQR